MASEDFTLQDILEFLSENGGKVKNKDVVRRFKNYLTDPATKDENRRKFKEYVNTLAHTRQEGEDKVLILKSKYLSSVDAPHSPLSSSTTNLSTLQNNPRRLNGTPNSPNQPNYDGSPYYSSPPRRPPPYRNPPPVISPSVSLDSISLSSNSTLDERPQAPPRRRGTMEGNRSNLLEPDGDNEKLNDSFVNNNNSNEREQQQEDDEEKEISVKERTQRFNRMASVEDELSPRVPKSAEKDRNKTWVTEDSDTAVITPIEPKKCQEWYVTASRGDCQELLKLAKDEPRLVNKKDPFTAYTVLHWGAKYGNAEIIKIFAGRYKVDVNGRTNGGYTPLHISAQFGHKNIFKLLIEVYKADTKIRDYSGRTAEYYLLTKEQKENNAVNLRSEYNNNSVASKYNTHGRAVRKTKSFRNKTISLPTAVQSTSKAVVGISAAPLGMLFQNYPTYPGTSGRK